MIDFAFEEISEEELRQELTAPIRTRQKRSKFDTTDRSLTAWFKLPHIQSFCTVPLHDEIQSLLSDEDKDFRQRYPVRMVYTIGIYRVCRDCYVAQADVDSLDQEIPPLEFDNDDR
jgi:hypothetical protein